MTTHTTLDRNAGIAVWRQIMEALKAEIVSGAFEKGSRLPPESELAARFGVNRHTVRRAIAALTSEGILRADQGRGTFVASAPLSYPIGPRTRFSEIVSGQDRAPDGRLIGSAVEEADAFLANQLSVPLGTLLIRVESLRVADGIPMIVATLWFEQARVPNFVADYAETGSITTALNRAGIEDYNRKETRITAELVEARDAQQLGISLGQPVMVVESVNLDTDGRPLQYTRGRVAADRMQLVVSGGE
ncbi:phosphonate metabolism transcriptional regulator PhnF [Roseibium sediminicola]|uniref:Phosphonate metabolism transcriptional regulator PhnF n=1 Tax=Roseibium sediminicola TaxID=2933272 RepID=A0ABT0H359_9HYPH|nr:phosphonate metabolism transcriptional regulator PhnF [Roseibium sp. CAU 1639]MCK7616113.1 phosphonate metabolism transcriptional regulator PhnF [Roseibium sp. CAU 1639]